MVVIAAEALSPKLQVYLDKLVNLIGGQEESDQGPARSSGGASPPEGATSREIVAYSTGSQPYGMLALRLEVSEGTLATGQSHPSQC